MIKSSSPWSLRRWTLSPGLPAIQIDETLLVLLGLVVGDGLGKARVRPSRASRGGVLGGGGRGGDLGAPKSSSAAGIVVDMIAGTSVGALTGIMYSAGLDPDYNANQFATDLRPSWIFRRLPRGTYWYLLYKYRRGHFDAMLRKYLHDWRLEQLAVPCLSVTVDLVSGNSVVRERGDAVHAILREHQLARALRADRPQRPGGDGQGRAGQQHPGGRCARCRWAAIS